MADQLIKVFKALSDQTRIDMVRELLKKNQEQSCQSLSGKSDKSQPTLSHHFNKLLDAGVIEVRKKGTENFYKVDEDFLTDLGINIEQLVAKGGSKK